MSVEVIRPTDIAIPSTPHSPATRAGNWVFISGQLATDYKSGVALEARVPEGHPFSLSWLRLQTSYIYSNMQKILRAADSSLDNLLRLDQFFTSEAMNESGGSSKPTMSEYLDERHRWVGHPRPASTAIPIEKFLVRGCHAEVDGIAVVNQAAQKAGVTSRNLPSYIAGLSDAATAGQYVFVTGRVATDMKSVAPQATRNENFWFGVDIKLQTSYVLNEIKTVLEESGSSLENIVHANVYLTNIKDLWGMDEVWKSYFPKNPPARTIVPFSMSPGGLQGAIIEITPTAIVPTGSIKKEVVRTDAVPEPVLHESQAVKAGDLLWISGLMAADEHGLAPDAAPLGRLDPNYPYHRPSAKRQVDVIMKNAKAICEVAGTSVENIARTKVFHTDLEHEFTSGNDAVYSHFPSRYTPAMTTVEVKKPLLVPECSILIDHVAYIPR